MNKQVVYKWLIACSLFTTSAFAQTTLFFRISAPTSNSEILGLHKWGTLVWTNDIPWSTCTIQSSVTPDGPWTNFNNGRAFVGYSNTYSQMVMPERIPSFGRWDWGGIVVWFDPILSETEQTNIISSYGLTGSFHSDYWLVYITQSNVFEWCGIFNCNPQVEDVDLLWTELSTKK